MRVGVVAQSWLAAAIGLGLLAGPVVAQVPEGAALGTQEDHPTITLPEPSPHWVYVLEPVFPYLVSSKVWILDGDTLDFVGMASAGYMANLVLSHDKSAFYIAETYWDRGTRGNRVDVVTLYDPRTLEVTGEVLLPEGRFLIVPKKYNAQLTTDGRYLLSFNMDPSFGLSVVDVKDKKYIGEIETGGCSLAYPTGPTSFASICPDGSFAHVTFDASGQAEITNTDPFFDSEKDPVFEHAAMYRPDKKAYFVSYEGWVYPVALDGMPQVGERWKLQGDDAELAGWRPGGWQLTAYHAPTDRLFVVMHEGGPWTHKQAGEEVWVFDATSHELLERVPLEEHSISITVSEDDQPLLFALTETATVQVYDATSFEHKGNKEGIGISPYLLYTFGE
ncbi:MAG TPA: amine dehydrogenase large subunit [Geminicoccaceae bacterium]|nr:amine dehydrogenase large subunit [Geminicoccaceae bacterium]